MLLGLAPVFLLYLQHISLFRSRSGLAILSNHSGAFCTEDFRQRTSFKTSLWCTLRYNLRFVLGDFGAKGGSREDRAHIGAGEAGPFVVEDADLVVALETMEVHMRRWRMRGTM